MHKLEEKKRDKLEESIALHKEISEIETLIKEHRTKYLLNNKMADECAEVLSGYGKDNVREILKFILFSNAKVSAEYAREYRNIDMDLLLSNDSFFDFLIVNIGRATIVDLKTHLNKVIEVDGESMMEVTGHSKKGLFNDNSKNRLFRKLTKNVVIRKARELQKETK